MSTTKINPVALLIWTAGILGAIVGAITIHPAVILLAIAPAYAIIRMARS
jgi:hypothetical protein